MYISLNLKVFQSSLQSLGLWPRTCKLATTVEKTGGYIFSLKGKRKNYIPAFQTRCTNLHYLQTSVKGFSLKINISSRELKSRQYFLSEVLKFTFFSFRPWWDNFEDFLVYGLVMLGLIVSPTAIINGTVTPCYVAFNNSN